MERLQEPQADLGRQFESPQPGLNREMVAAWAHNIHRDGVWIFPGFNLEAKNAIGAIWFPTPNRNPYNQVPHADRGKLPCISAFWCEKRRGIRRTGFSRFTDTLNAVRTHLPLLRSSILDVEVWRRKIDLALDPGLSGPHSSDLQCKTLDELRADVSSLGSDSLEFIEAVQADCHALIKTWDEGDLALVSNRICHFSVEGKGRSKLLVGVLG